MWGPYLTSSDLIYAFRCLIFRYDARAGAQIVIVGRIKHWLLYHDWNTQVRGWYGINDVLHAYLFWWCLIRVDNHELWTYWVDSGLTYIHVLNWLDIFILIWLWALHPHSIYTFMRYWFQWGILFWKKMRHFYKTLSRSTSWRCGLRLRYEL